MENNLPAEDSAFGASWALLEEVVERFEKAWYSGQAPSIKKYLPTGPQRLAILAELIRVDQEFRLKSGDSVHVESYLEKYPEIAKQESLVLNLIGRERAFRIQHDGQHSLAEYQRRFPEYANRLESLLETPTLCKDLSRQGDNKVLADLASPASAPKAVSGVPSDPGLLPLEHTLCKADLSSPAGAQVESPTLSGSARQRFGPDEKPLKSPASGDPNARAQPSVEAHDATLIGSSGREHDRLRTTPGDQTEFYPQVTGYEILGVLGRGGMGKVFKAKQLRLKRIVALKMILTGPNSQADHEIRFRAEAEVVARLQHPNIVQLYEVGDANGAPFIALEFVDGGSLDKKLEGTPLLPKTAAKLVETLAGAMEAAHLQGIVHRDLKPANILLAGGSEVSVDRGVPEITDFGLAKQLNADSSQTQSGVIIGTPCYMPPEQAAGRIEKIGPLSDVYSLGAILYECLTGRPPFKAADVFETIEQVVKEEPVAPSRLQPKVPRDLETICLKSIEKQPENRYASAGALAADLKRFLDGEPIEARRIGLGERAVKWARRRPTAATLVSVLVAVGLAIPIAAWLFFAQETQRRSAEQKRVDEARAEVHDLSTRGQTAYESQDCKQAELLLDRAMQKIDAEPALADLRANLDALRIPVKDRLRALDTLEHFLIDRDDALFHATLAGGEKFQANSETAAKKARAALACVGLAPDSKNTLVVGPSIHRDEAVEITTGCYALLLILAEVECRRMPKQTPEQYREHIRIALDYLDRADALGVRSRATHFRRARYLTLLGDKAGAEKESSLAQTLESETDLDAQDHFLVGHDLYNEGEFDRATQEFQRALQVNPRHFWTHYFLGICSVTLGKSEVAVAHLSVCQSQQPKLSWIYVLRGFAMGQMEYYAAAEADFSKALALKPSPATSYVLYNNRGVMRVGRKETWTQGVDDLNQAIALRPDQYQAEASLAEAYRLTGSRESAGTHLDKAIAIASEQVQAGELRPETLARLYHTRARLLLERADREAALSDLKEAARLADDELPLQAQANADRGRVLHLLKRFDDAVDAYDAALEADAGRVDVLRWRGEALLALHRYADAVAAFNGFLQKGGAASTATCRQLGLALSNIGRHADSVEEYSRALAAHPQDDEKAGLHLQRGQEYLYLNALQPALRDFEATLTLEPNNVDAHLGRGHTRVSLGVLAKGVGDAEQAVQGEPKEARVWHGAARIYAQAAGQLKAEPRQYADQTLLRSRYQDRAVELLKKALTLVPADQRQVYWFEQVKNDAGLAAVQGKLPEITAWFGLRDR